jgi:hypothetical protein
MVGVIDGHELFLEFLAGLYGKVLPRAVQGRNTREMLASLVVIDVRDQLHPPFTSRVPSPVGDELRGGQQAFPPAVSGDIGAQAHTVFFRIRKRGVDELGDGLDSHGQRFVDLLLESHVVPSQVQAALLAARRTEARNRES